VGAVAVPLVGGALEVNLGWYAVFLGTFSSEVTDQWRLGGTVRRSGLGMSLGPITGRPVVIRNYPSRQAWLEGNGELATSHLRADYGRGNG